MKLTSDFYLRTDVVQIAKDLLGKYLFTHYDHVTTGGIITETEAYNGVNDKASHAYGNRRTQRTEIIYATGGTAYVYLCYGIHSLFNVVANEKDIPHAVLIRALFPTEGIEQMLVRRKMSKQKKNLTAGPGTVSQALGIHYSDTGTSLLSNTIWIEDRGLEVKNFKTSPRIGVAYAKEDALLPYRFVANHKDIELLLQQHRESKNRK